MRFFVVTLKYKKRAAISDHPLSHTKPMRLTMFWLQYIYSSIGKVLNLYQCWQCYCLDGFVYCFHMALVITTVGGFCSKIARTVQR